MATSMQGQLGHRDQDFDVKDADSDQAGVSGRNLTSEPFVTVDECSGAQRELMHSHPPRVVFITSDGQLRTMLPNGSVSETSFKAGEVDWRDATTHAAENVGTTEFTALAIELSLAAIPTEGAPLISQMAEQVITPNSTRALPVASISRRRHLIQGTNRNGEKGAEVRSNVIVLAGIGLGVVAYLLLRKMARSKQAGDIQLKTQDLDYPNLSREDLISNHLTDLNASDSGQLQALGLDAQAAERLIENRPYRSKLELVSRMVLAEDIYRQIKDKIGVSNARESFKVA